MSVIHQRLFPETMRPMQTSRNIQNLQPPAAVAAVISIIATITTAMAAAAAAMATANSIQPTEAARVMHLKVPSTKPTPCRVQRVPTTTERTINF